MANRISHYTTTIPASTAKTSPHIVDIPIDFLEVTAIGCIVPKGPALQMGFAIYRSGQIVVPYEDSQWFVWDDHAETFSLTDFPTGGGWQVYGYNTGDYDHSVYTTWYLDTPVAASSGALPSVSFLQSVS